MNAVDHKKPAAIRLPPAADQNGASLFAALETRKTTREIGAKPHPEAA